MGKHHRKADVFKMPKGSALERVKLLRYDNPDVADARQRKIMMHTARRQSEDAAAHQRELMQLQAHLRKVAPHAQAADIQLRAGKLFKKYHHLDFAP